MRIRMHLPRVEPEKYDVPAVCPYEKCGGNHFKLHQRQCQRAVLDPDHHQVNVRQRRLSSFLRKLPSFRKEAVRRYRCLRCKRTFRVYPCGVSGSQRSDRLEGIGIMLYVLGLSYGAVEDALAAGEQKQRLSRRTGGRAGDKTGAWGPGGAQSARAER